RAASRARRGGGRAGLGAPGPRERGARRRSRQPGGGGAPRPGPRCVALVDRAGAGPPGARATLSPGRRATPRSPRPAPRCVALVERAGAGPRVAREALPRGRPATARPPRPPRRRPMISPIRWSRGRLCRLAQRRLPVEEVERPCTDWREVADAIRTLAVRGAPAIGVAAAFGVALAARARAAREPAALLADLEQAPAGLPASRPTAVTLFWAFERMRGAARPGRALPVAALRD